MQAIKGTQNDYCKTLQTGKSSFDGSIKNDWNEKHLWTTQTVDTKHPVPDLGKGQTNAAGLQVGDRHKSSSLPELTNSSIHLSL